MTQIVTTKNKDLWIRGRADEVIKVSGHRIGTAEIENAIVQVNGVSEAAVIGVSDPVKGQTIVALVALKDGVVVQDDFDNIIKKAIAADLGSYARPEVIEFVSELPKTRSGKILRRIINNLIEKKPIGDTSTLENKHSIEELSNACLEVANKLKETAR